jgi:hypothetical protein
MSNELTVPTADELDLIPDVDEESLTEVMGDSFDRIPYIKLITPQSGKLIAKGFPANNYGMNVGEDVPQVLGPDVNVLPLFCKPMAMDLADSDNRYRIYDVNNPHFKRIVTEASKPGENAGYMHGPDFLMWLVEEARLVTMFFGSVSARIVAPELRAQLKKMTVLGSKEVSNAKYSWFVPSVTASDASMPELDMPTVVAAIEKYKNQPDYVPGEADLDATSEHGDDSSSRDR